MINYKPKFWDKKSLSIASIALYPFSLITRFFLLITKFKKSKKFNIPVICVGNIYIGGTGKTPICIKLYDFLKNEGMKPAFIKKYYDFLSDEINVLKSRGKVYSDKNRIQSIDKLINDGNNVAIVDDGYQDYSFDRKLNILCFNENQWIGNGMVVPSGPLREKISSVKRANCILINGNQDNQKEKLLLKYNPSLRFFYFTYRMLNLESITNNKVFAFAGIGNPTNFFNLLRANNLNLIGTKSFPDHYKYKRFDLENLIDIAKSKNALLLTTEKDFFRIDKEFQNLFKFVKITATLENEKEFANFIVSNI